MLRSHTCGELTAEHIGAQVTLTGWVNRRRDHGEITFINLRDRYGITQVVLDPDVDRSAFEAGQGIGVEWVLAIEGEVRARPEGQSNPDMKTGEIEVVATALRVLNPAKTPPFEVSRDIHVDDSTRLKYRYLDLRRERMSRNIVLRHRVNQFIRRRLDEERFIEVETPILFKATPEGARDFLVPSRVHHGRFYALPQSPQQIKQLLMVAGVDRYYQIARCFRDEDLRADRELEFTQLDIEMSFVEAEDVMALNESMLIDLAREVAPHMKIAQAPFPRMTYAEAMERYGSDKPDLRFGLELVDIGPAVADSDFKVFSGTVSGGGQVKAIAVDHAFTRREIDELEAFVQALGARGLAWLAFDAEKTRGSVARFLSEAEMSDIRERTGAGEGHTVFIMAGDAALVAKCLGMLRGELARRLELIPGDELHFLWITEPPMLEWNPDDERYVAVHHPFTAPDPRDLDALEHSPGEVRALAYDAVLNGYEICGGSIRIHDQGIQSRVFALLGLSAAQTEAQFGHILKAFELGAPPHGGIAWGLDRMVAILAGETNIREVIAFPKSLSAVDLMTGAPSPVPEEDLKILGIRLAASPPPDAEPSAADAGSAPA